MIKYRAWHKDNSKVYEVDRIDFRKGYVWGNRKMFQMRDIELLQSVGRKDSNGVDLFVGDTVSFSVAPYLSPTGAKKITMSGSIRWDDEDFCFYIDSDNASYPWVYIRDAHDITVTGSIFL